MKQLRKQPKKQKGTHPSNTPENFRNSKNNAQLGANAFGFLLLHAQRMLPVRLEFVFEHSEFWFLDLFGNCTFGFSVFGPRAIQICSTGHADFCNGPFRFVQRAIRSSATGHSDFCQRAIRISARGHCTMRIYCISCFVVTSFRSLTVNPSCDYMRRDRDKDRECERENTRESERERERERRKRERERERE